MQVGCRGQVGFRRAMNDQLDRGGEGNGFFGFET
jgi:hypothetical protein